MADIDYPMRSGNITDARIQAPGVYGNFRVPRDAMRRSSAAGQSLGRAMQSFAEVLSEGRRVHELNSFYIKAVKDADDIETALKQDEDLDTVPDRHAKKLRVVVDLRAGVSPGPVTIAHPPDGVTVTLDGSTTPSP